MDTPDPHHINQFLSQHHQRFGGRQMQPWSWSGRPSIPQTLYQYLDDNVDDASAALPDMELMTTADTYSPVSSVATVDYQAEASIASHSTKQPSLFSRPSTHTAATTLPSRHHHHHHHHGHGHPHRPPTFLEQFAQFHITPPNVLWCEFHKLANCKRTFHGDDEAGWIAHHIAHLQDRMPAECACWYCDFVPFRPPRTADNDDDDDDQDLRRDIFRERMEHIREHIIHDGKRREQMRIDYFLVEHMWRHRLIPFEAYQWARSHTELPRSLQFPKSREPVGVVPDPALSRQAMMEVDLEREERKRRRDGNQNRRGYTGDADRAPRF